MMNALTKFDVVIPMNVIYYIYSLYLSDKQSEETEEQQFGSIFLLFENFIFKSLDLDAFNEEVRKIGLTIPEYDYRPPRNRIRTSEIAQLVEIFTVLSAQIELREEAVLSTNKILMICGATIKQIENEIPAKKECIKVLEMVKKMVQTVLMSKSREKYEIEDDLLNEISTKNSEADGLSPALQLFYLLLCILKRAQYASTDMAVICSDILEILTSKVSSSKTLEKIYKLTI